MIEKGLGMVVLVHQLDILDFQRNDLIYKQNLCVVSEFGINIKKKIIRKRSGSESRFEI